MRAYHDPAKNATHAAQSVGYKHRNRKQAPMSTPTETLRQIVRDILLEEVQRQNLNDREIGDRYLLATGVRAPGSDISTLNRLRNGGQLTPKTERLLMVATGLDPEKVSRAAMRRWRASLVTEGAKAIPRKSHPPR